MLILLWLVPPAAFTVVVALIVGWVGREAGHATETRAERQRAVERMAKALSDGRPAVKAPAPARAPERSTGIAVRRKAS